MEKFKKSIIASLAGKFDLLSVIEILKRYKAAGGKQEEALNVLEQIRYLKGEEFEDKILEIMDIVSGFCNPSYRIWQQKAAE